MKRHLWKSIIALIVLAVALAIPAAASENNTFQIAVDGYQDYDEANAILNYVNSYRAAAGVAPLKMEPELTKLAMQRAAEVAVYYSHTRPNDTSCGTVMNGTVFENRSWGENIAINQQDAKEVSTDWKNSPGHYANMVHTAFKSIGIGCFYQEDGTRCWVQLFSDVVTSSTNNKKGVTAVENVAVEASPKYVSLQVSAANDCGTVELYAGQQQRLELTAVNAGFSYKKVVLSDNYKMQSSNTSVVQINGASVIGVAAGKATVYIRLGSKQVAIPVEVSPKPVLSYAKNNAEQTVISWNDPTGNTILFFKEIYDDMWCYAGSGGSYNMGYLSERDIYCFVLRVYNGEEYVNVSDEMVVGDTSALKPSITSQPTSKVVKSGDTAKFTVKTSGYGLSYQWQYRTSSKGSWKTASATGSKTATLSVPGTTSRHGYQYRCRITDNAGHTLYSSIVTLHVLGVKTQPSSKIVKSGATAKFTVAATGTGLKYQWQYRTSSKGNWKNASATGSKTATLSVSGTVSRHGYQYRCQITDSKGNTVYTNASTLYVLGIKTQPTGKTVVSGKTAKLTVAATGHKVTYQWQYRTSSTGSWKNAKATGSKAATLSVSATASKHGYQYRCRITDSKGNKVYTDTVTLYVLGIKTQPVNRTVKAGATAKFTVSAVGRGLTYQWQYKTASSGTWKNVTAAAGKKATYSMTAASRHNGNQYRCRITDAAGNVIYSGNVKITVK